jgi:hypothetical protein
MERLSASAWEIEAPGNYSFSRFFLNMRGEELAET